MKLSRIQAESFLIRNIPGPGHFLQGRRVFGTVVFLGFIAFPLVIVMHFEEFVSGIVSFFLSMTMLALEPSLKESVLRPELVEHWVAALFAISAPVLVWSMDRKYILRTTSADTDEMNQYDRSWTAFIRQKSAVTGMVVIFALYSIAFLCPYIAPYNPNYFQNGIVTQFKPPMSTSIVLHLREKPRVEQGIAFRDNWTGYPKLRLTLAQINNRLMSDGNTGPLQYVDAYRIEGDAVVATVGHESMSIQIASLISAEPEVFASEQLHILGTDSYGRDLLSRIIYGSRISLSLGFIAVLLSVVLGTVIGLFAGYFGGKIDSIIMRIVDVLLAFPSLFLILIFIAVFEQANAPRILLIVVILGLTTWMGVSRLVRGEVLSLKERDFVLAAKAMGLRHTQILFRHLLPNAMTPIIINATLRIGSIILLEAALSFLNLGVQQPTASWGNIIYEGKDFLATAWWISTLPGFAIVLTVVSFNLIGDGLRDAFDPMLENS